MSNKFKIIREKCGLTQEAVAKATSISPQFISAIENGRREPSWKYAIQLADLYNVSLDDFRECDELIIERRCE